MATAAQLRAMTTALPFFPFRIKLAGGTVYTIARPENAACDTAGRALIVFDDQGMHLVEMLLVEEMERIPSAADAGGNGD
jgi:hypothetical protein